MRIEIDHGGRTSTSDAVQGASIGMDGFMARFEQMMKLQAEADAMRLARADGDRRAAAHQLDMEMGREDLRQSREAFPVRQDALKQEMNLRTRAEDRAQARDNREAAEDADRSRARQMSMEDAQRSREDEATRVGRALQELRAAGMNPAQLQAASGLSAERLEALVESRRLERHAKHRATDAADYVRDLYGRGGFGQPMEGPPEPGQPLGAAEQMVESILAELEADPYSADRVMQRAQEVENQQFEIAKRREQRAAVVESLQPLIQQIDSPRLFAEAMSAVKGYVAGVHNDVSTVFSKVGDAMWLSQMDLSNINEMSQGNPALRNAIIAERDAVEQGHQDSKAAGMRIRRMIQDQTLLTPAQNEPSTLTLPLGAKKDGAFEPVKVIVPPSAMGRGRALSSLRPAENADDHGAMLFWYDQASKVDQAAARDILGDKKAKMSDQETVKRLAREMQLRYGGWSR